MTKAQFRKKFRELVRHQTAWMHRFAEAALKSGTFDLPSEPDDYALAKDVFCAACERLSSTRSGYGPVTRKSKKRIEGIRANTPSVR